MAKKHLILIASVAAALAVAAPVAMAAPLPELPGVPALPGATVGQPNDGVCTDGPGAAEASSDEPALQLPVAGASHGNENCQSAGNEQGNGLGGGGSLPQ